LAAALLVTFVFYERFALTHQKSVLLDLRLFSIRSFAYGNLAALIINLGEFGLLFALPLFLQSVTGLSALGTGAVLFALASGAFLAGPAAGQLAARVGSVLIVRVGLILEIIGIVGIALVVSPSATGWTFVPWLFVYGLGVGFATAQITNVILADIPVGESGQGSAAQSTARQIGAALGTAVLGAVLVSTVRSQTNSGLQDLGLSSAEAARLAGEITAQPSQAIPNLLGQPDGEAVLAIAGESFATATAYVGFVAALFIVVGLLATFLLPKQPAKV